MANYTIIPQKTKVDNKTLEINEAGEIQIKSSNFVKYQTTTNDKFSGKTDYCSLTVEKSGTYLVTGKIPDIEIDKGARFAIKKNGEIIREYFKSDEILQHLDITTIIDLNSNDTLNLSTTDIQYDGSATVNNGDEIMYLEAKKLV